MIRKKTISNGQNSCGRLKHFIFSTLSTRDPILVIEQKRLDGGSADGRGEGAFDKRSKRNSI